MSAPGQRACLCHQISGNIAAAQAKGASDFLEGFTFIPQIHRCIATEVVHLPGRKRMAFNHQQSVPWEIGQYLSYGFLSYSQPLVNGM